MIPFLSALAGLTYVRCPHCGEVQTVSRKQERPRCRACRRSFAQREGRESLERAVDRARRRS